MVTRSKAPRLLLIGALVLGAGAAVYFLALRQERGLPDAETPAGLAVAPMEYEFVWRDGDVRGVDVPTKVLNPKNGKLVSILPIQDIVSLEGEDKIDFLHRAREVMVAYSEKHTHEACGEICSNGATLSIRITTNAAVTRCAVAPICMPGHESTLSSIHSHCPSRGQLRATSADEDLGDGDTKRGMRLPRCDTERFSALDLAGRQPGYLAGRRALHEHHGPGQVARYEINASGELAAAKASRTAN